MKKREDIVKDIMQQTSQHIPQITNYRSGGIFRSFIEVVAMFLEKIYMELESTLPNRFLLKATGKYLDLKAEELNLTRILPKKTRGYVIFSRKDISNQVIIPKGKIVATKNQEFRYKVVEENILPKGQNVCSVLVEAENEGSEYNAGGEMITELLTPINGIDTIYNGYDWITLMGQNLESDESLRSRCISLWSGLSGANKETYVSWAQSVEGIGNVRVIPLSRGLGTIDVICLGTDNKQPNQELLNKVSDIIDSRKPLGTNILIKSPQEILIDINMSVILDPSVEISKESIKEVIEKYFNNLSIGIDVEPSALIGQVFLLEGVKSVEIHRPDSTVITELQIARLGNIFIELSNSQEG